MPERFRRTGVALGLGRREPRRPADRFVPRRTGVRHGRQPVRRPTFHSAASSASTPQAQWEQVARVRRRAQRHEVPERPRTADHRLQERPDGAATSPPARCGRILRAAQQRTLQGRQRPDVRFDAATSTSPTRARPACTIPRAASTACAPDGQLDLLLAQRPESERRGACRRTRRCSIVAATRGNCVWRVPLMRATAASPRSASSSPRTDRAAPTAWPMDEQGRLVVANPGLGVGLGAQPPRGAGDRCGAARACRSPTSPSAARSARPCSAPSRSAAASCEPISKSPGYRFIGVQP